MILIESGKLDYKSYSINDILEYRIKLLAKLESYEKSLILDYKEQKTAENNWILNSFPEISIGDEKILIFYNPEKHSLFFGLNFYNFDINKYDIVKCNDIHTCNVCLNGTNKVRLYSPFFVFSFALIKQNNDYYLLNEKIENKLSFLSILPSINENVFFDIILQILEGFKIANENISYTHYDFNLDSIFLIKQNDRYVVKLNPISNGKAFFKDKNVKNREVSFGVPFYDKKDYLNGIFRDRSIGYNNDIFKFLCHCYSKTENLEIKNIVCKLLSFFIKDDEKTSKPLFENIENLVLKVYNTCDENYCLPNFKSKIILEEFMKNNFSNTFYTKYSSVSTVEWNTSFLKYDTSESDVSYFKKEEKGSILQDIFISAVISTDKKTRTEQHNNFLEKYSGFLEEYFNIEDFSKGKTILQIELNNVKNILTSEIKKYNNDYDFRFFFFLYYCIMKLKILKSNLEEFYDLGKENSENLENIFNDLIKTQLTNIVYKLNKDKISNDQKLKLFFNKIIKKQLD